MTDPRRAPSPYATWVDVLLAAAVAAAEIIGTEILVRAGGAERAPDALGLALLVANAAPLAVRDRYPVSVLLAVAATTVAYTWLGYAGGFYTIALFFAVWTAVAAGHRLAAVLAGLGVLAAVVAATFVVRSGHAADADAPIWLGGWLVASFVLGEVSRGRRRYLAEVEQRAIDAERSREEEALRRAGEERLRIARELHDVLAHNVSLINVQAGVAVHLLDRRPEQARTALIAISRASKEALRELRATLGVLRDVDQADPRSPTPGLAQLDELVDPARATGLAVDVEIVGEPRALPAATDLAAYRIIQESLTNASRHSGAEHVAISIRHGAAAVDVTVEDDGAGLPPGAVLREGNGLTGMRERAAAAGGELEAGPRPEGGFRVRARLPSEGTT